MCGIAGILDGSQGPPVEFEHLRRMVAMLRHRGPDEYGLYRDGQIGLAHSRLSIIDLAGGSQPIHNEDKTVWVAFNGEVFNYIELRAQLEALGHRFYTQSDTEVIVHCYEQYGQLAWERLNGQFAIALWDRADRKLLLVRDRMGILPLFHARAGAAVLFASEAKALFASGRLTPKFDKTGLVETFVRWAPTPPNTVFQGVRSVPPGAVVCFDRDLRESLRYYWKPDLSEAAELRNLSVPEAAEALGEKLTRAVRLRLRADVPVGAYLSGGLDSSMISSLIHQADSSPLQTFAVRFEDPRFDETAEQRRMAELLGTQHHEFLCGPAEIREALPDVIWHCETPLLRTAPAPLFLLSRLVHSRGMKVVLTGEGADELLAGYDVFREDKIRRFWARRPDSKMRSALLSRLYAYVGDSEGKNNALWRRFFGRGLTETDHPFYSHRIRWANTGWSLRFLGRNVRDGVDPESLDARTQLALPDGWEEWGALGRAQAIEIRTFLSPYLLACQGDRMGMGHSLEIRPPFLDPHVVDFCCHLPARLKLRGLRGKVALRALGARSLPADIWNRPKHPYRAPMTPPLFGADSPDYVEALMSESSLRQSGFIDSSAAGKLVAKARRQEGRMGGEREEMALVGLLTLQLLGRFFMEEFSDRAAQARKALDNCQLAVLEDHSP